MIPPVYAGKLINKQKETIVMAKGKSKSRSSPVFVKGGSGHMVGQQHAGPRTPGTTSPGSSGDGGKFAKGGSGHMVGKQTSSPAKPA